jgi:hypothetical protein
LPARARKDVSQPFPCQDNPCGCQSAEQCWTTCCCYTVEEHWAWARAHDVEPPPYATRPADDGWNTKPLREQEESKPASELCACCHEKVSREIPKKPAARWVNGLAALRCQGGSLPGLAGAVSTPPPPIVIWAHRQPEVGRLAPADISSVRVFLDPVDPPPRLASIPVHV